MISSGQLELYLGPMFSGKSSKLIHAYKKWSLCDYTPLVINYSEDTRYSSEADHIITHDQSKIVKRYSTRTTMAEGNIYGAPVKSAYQKHGWVRGRASCRKVSGQRSGRS